MEWQVSPLSSDRSGSPLTSSRISDQGKSRLRDRVGAGQQCLAARICGPEDTEDLGQGARTDSTGHGRDPRDVLLRQKGLRVPVRGMRFRCPLE